MGTGSHFPRLRAWSYLADPRAPSGNLSGHAAPAFDIFRFELYIETFGPSFRYLLLSFIVVSLGGDERVALSTVQATIGKELRHNSRFLLVDIRRYLAGLIDELTTDVRRSSQL